MGLSAKFVGLFKKGADVIAKKKQDKIIDAIKKGKTINVEDFKKLADGINKVVGKCSKAHFEAMKNTGKITYNPKPSSVADKYRVLKAAFAKEGVTMPAILNNKLSVKDRIAYWTKQLAARQQKKSDIAAAFVNPENYVK